MAIEYIHLDEISNPHTVQNSDQPSFGPIWIYLYDRPYILAKQKVFKINLQDLKKESTITNNCKFCENNKYHTLSQDGAFLNSFVILILTLFLTIIIIET